MIAHVFCGVCSYQEAMLGEEETAYCGAEREKGNDQFTLSNPLDQCIVCVELSVNGCPRCTERMGGA